MITRKHMVRFADELYRFAAKEEEAAVRSGIENSRQHQYQMEVFWDVVRVVAKVIGEDNPRFDEQRFLVAAGLEDG